MVDDAKYPDIAQEIGIIDVTQNVPAAAPLEVIAKSDSEDQAMAWSPNGKWIAFHTHREMSDDVWLRPVDGSQPDKRITFLGRGAEVGWPRWSPDGKTVLLDGARKSDGNSVIYAIGVDQDSGKVTSELREVRAEGFAGDITHAEWLGNDTVIGVAKEAPGRHVIMTLPLGGGAPRIVHRFETEHDFPGLGVSSDGRYVAFVAPAPDGFYQIFRKAIVGDAAPLQLTNDPSTQDATGVVAGRSTRGVHRVELRRDVLVVSRAMTRALPDWLPRSIQTIASGYDGRAFLADLVAGVTVGLVALPLAMAFAIASGLTPQAGIYCAIITGFMISALGGSRFQIGGPTGAFVVVVAGIIAEYGVDGLFMCTMMAGVMLAIMGLTGTGSGGQIHSASGDHRIHERHCDRDREHATA